MLHIISNAPEKQKVFLAEIKISVFHSCGFPTSFAHLWHNSRVAFNPPPTYIFITSSYVVSREINRVILCRRVPTDLLIFYSKLNCTDRTRVCSYRVINHFLLTIPQIHISWRHELGSDSSGQGRRGVFGSVGRPSWIGSSVGEFLCRNGPRSSFFVIQS